ncbi:MAG TPA: polysaccharide biosynthesis C-terminal domain-containing protein, partial [Bacteroidales bacterium]|nr:polysaccharide biosynthesis C-terminal domain-containing protein [Bacteroidales bacterium]
GASLIFIPLFGITGAAVASMISNIIYNLLSVVVVGRKFGIWPYNSTHIRMTIIGLGAALAGFLMPELSLWPDVIIRSLLVAILFTAGVYLWKLSDDMNMLIDPFIARLKKRL